MVKKNNLRKLYMVYLIVLVELFCIALAVCAGYIEDPVLGLIVRIGGIAGIIVVPFAMYIFYRWRTKDNANSSDELEQSMLLKAFALTGLVALTLSPVLLILTCIFTEAAGYIAFGYLAVIAGTFKMSTYYYYRKY